MPTYELQEVDALYGSQGDRMGKLLAKYRSEEFAVITNFLEQMSATLEAKMQALKFAKNPNSKLFGDN